MVKDKGQKAIIITFKDGTKTGYGPDLDTNTSEKW